MDESLIEIYQLLFSNWESEKMQVQIAPTIKMIVRNHFGEEETQDFTLPELVNTYWLCSRDIIDYLEMERPSIPMDLITKEAHKFLKQVLNLDPYTLNLMRDALGDSVDSSGPVI
tara:strand:- start:7383 stop:7727 length:345 start_codon:yes stop_codon:yes gene_type:complete